MTNVLIGVSAGLGALALLLASLLVVGRRRQVAAEAHLTQVITMLTARVEELEQERDPDLDQLSATIELDEVLSRTLGAATSRGAEAALVMLPDPAGGKPFVATTGLSEQEAERLTVVAPSGLRSARSVRMSYGYAAAPDASVDEADAIQCGLAVPMPGNADRAGYLAIFTRRPTSEFGDDDVRALEAVAARAGPAIANARRFREARQLADLDALTNLHNRRFFHEALAREIARAQRYERKLALIVFDLDDFKRVNDEIGHLAGDAVLAEAADRVRGVVRSADVACRVGGDEFAVILPESSVDDAERLYRRIRHAVTTRPLSRSGKLNLSAGVAELTPGDDAVTFFQRADDAMYRAKSAGKGHVVSANA